MRKETRILAALVIWALALSTVVVAQATPEAAVNLVNDQVVSGTLTGSRAGAFAYYRVDNPGDGTVVTIDLWYVPSDPVTNAAVGMNVYGPNGFVIGPPQPETDEDGNIVLRVQWADDNPASWLVQVYNYLPDKTIDYTLKATGLAEPFAVAGPLGPAAEPVVPPMGEEGVLVGTNGGAFATMDVEVPADGEDVQVTLHWTPDDPVIANAVGFFVNGPEAYTGTGQPTGTPGERRITLPAEKPGTYQVHVFNYIDGLPIAYRVSTGPVAES